MSVDMDRRKFLGAVSATITGFFAGCGGGGDAAGGGGGGGEVTATIELQSDDKYHPKTVSIAPGEAVEWVNKTGTRREVRATSDVDGAENWDFQGRMEPDGGTATHTFQEGGVYAFHDSLNTQFLSCGAVAVGDASSEDASLPC